VALADARLDLPRRRAGPAVQPQAVAGQDRVQGIEVELAPPQAEEIDRLFARQQLPQQDTSSGSARARPLRASSRSARRGAPAARAVA
jgi:hypothetical protein